MHRDASDWLSFVKTRRGNVTHGKYLPYEDVIALASMNAIARERMRRDVVQTYLDAKVSGLP